MSDPPSTSTPPPVLPGDPLAASTAESAEKRKKKRDKVRSAWISFVGRILAQFVGAAASIMLGLMFIQKYQTTSASSSDKAARSSAAAELRPALDTDRPKAGRMSLAILPFENFSGDPRQESLANAMTEALIAVLSQRHELRVTSRTSSMQYKGARKPLPQIARELGVHWIVEGSVVTAPGRVRVVGQLIDGSTDEHVWSQTYDRPFRSVLSLQAGLAPVMARDIGKTVTAARGSVTGG